MTSIPYSPPVARLLTLGREPALRRVWPNYLHLGLRAQHVADLIAMGTRGLSGLRHLLMGSTAERAVEHAPCPVMTIRRPA